MNIRAFPVMASFAVLLAATPAGAGSLSLGASAGTPGLGAELGWAFSDHLSLRAGAWAFDYDYDGEESGIDYESDLELRSGGLFLDWRPFAGVFTVSAGLYANGNEVNAAAVPGPGDEYEIGGETFTADEVGDLNASVDFNSTAPYLGLGWRSRGGDDGGLGFSLDLGVMFMGSPDVELVSTGGTLSGNPLLQAELDAEEAELEDEVDGYELYPVLQVGVSWTF